MPNPIAAATFEYHSPKNLLTDSIPTREQMQTTPDFIEALDIHNKVFTENWYRLESEQEQINWGPLGFLKLGEGRNNFVAGIVGPDGQHYAIRYNVSHMDNFDYMLYNADLHCQELARAQTVGTPAAGTCIVVENSDLNIAYALVKDVTDGRAKYLSHKDIGPYMGSLEGEGIMIDTQEVDWSGFEHIKRTIPREYLIFGHSDMTLKVSGGEEEAVTQPITVPVTKTNPDTDTTLDFVAAEPPTWSEGLAAVGGLETVLSAVVVSGFAIWAVPKIIEYGRNWLKPSPVYA